MNILSFNRAWIIGILLVLCVSCAGTGSTGTVANNTGKAASDIDTSDIDEKPGSVQYYVLVAESALQKSLYAVAAENYRKAAMLSDDVKVAIRATVVAFEVKANDDALIAAKRWLALAPDDVKALPFLARLYVRKKDARTAAKYLKKMLQGVDAEPAEAFLPLGSVLSSEEHADVALQALTILVKSYRKVPQAHYVVGIQALRNGKFDTARERAQISIDLDDTWTPAHLLYARALIASGNVDGGIEYAGIHVGGDSSVGERVEYGVLLAAVNRDIEAYVVLEQVLSDDPTNLEALRILGIIDLKNGDIDLAESRFIHLLSSGAATNDAYYYLAGISETKEQNQRAYRLYSEVQSGDKAVISQLRAAYILYREEQLDEALSHLDRFARANPQHTYEMAMAQGDLLTEAGREDEAMMLYDNMLQKKPDERRTQFAKAFLLERMDRVDEAIHQMQVILATDPQDPTALNALGYTLADRTDRHQEALELISMAYDKQPDSGPIIDSLGWVNFKMGNLERARELLEKAYELVNDSEIAAHLIEVAYTQGDSDFLDTFVPQMREKFADDKKLEGVLMRLGL